MRAPCCAWAAPWSITTAQSFRQVPRRIVLDIDDTFDAVHGGQQLRLFNAHHDEYGFQPIVAFDGEGRMIAAVLRPACRPTGRQIVRWLRRLIAAIRANWPRVEILLRADSHYCTPEVLRFCRAERLDYVLGVAPTTTLRKHVAMLEASTVGRAASGRRREAAPFQGIPRRRRKLGPRRAHHRPRRGRTAGRPIPASSSPASTASAAAPSTRTSTAPAARPKTTSRPGRRIWPPIAPHAAAPPPTRCGCSCMSAPTG